MKIMYSITEAQLKAVAYKTVRLINKNLSSEKVNYHDMVEVISKAIPQVAFKWDAEAKRNKDGSIKSLNSKDQKQQYMMNKDDDIELPHELDIVETISGTDMIRKDAIRKGYGAVSVVKHYVGSGF
jgi:hypothetical protein